MLKRIVAGVVVVLMLTAGAAAGPLEDGFAAYQRGDFVAALGLWRPLAEQGHAEAQAVLGSVYYHGDGAPQDFVEAAKWFRLAAEQGFAPARYSLGFMYDNGLGVPEDDAEALKLYRLAADQGDITAKFELGLKYAKGEDVPQDFVQAHMWFNLAVAQGEENAVKNRDIVAGMMTPDQLAEAQRMAREWLAAHRPSTRV